MHKCIVCLTVPGSSFCKYKYAFRRNIYFMVPLGKYPFSYLPGLSSIYHFCNTIIMLLFFNFKVDPVVSFDKFCRSSLYLVLSLSILGGGSQITLAL